MEHEVFVPVPAERLGEVLADPERVARAVPGFQQDAGAEPGAGRLKVRVGGHTITYRGAFGALRRDDGSYAFEGDATEARGSGAVRLALTVRLRPDGAGTVLTFTGTVTATGRIAELPAETVRSAGARLLTRAAENAGRAAAEPPRPPASGTGAEPRPPEAEGGAEPRPPVSAPGEESAEPGTSLFETEVPPPSLEGPDDLDGSEDSGDSDDSDDSEAEPPAEAAHARRTMIGRSAEEVDHAPPRGRYAPVPAPEATGSAGALRWAAPAAAVVLASAIVMSRYLRRRR
ncbi:MULTISPECIES: SRPBCC family protein [unclassified Streptomyces]|uniref:SRPBCC family protein n=1 Tax=unclassified Streptomyces TaxID=2593676 RepID=UPI0004C12919|nr:MULTISPECIES: SRPBCC family protein [unclassified Streptomyces]